MINITEEIKVTKIYLVTNCYGDPNKVYIGKEKQPQKYSRKGKHQLKFGDQIIFEYIDQTNGWNYKDWEPLETFWMNYFKFLGFEVVNIRKKGGSGPEFHTEETKQKLSKTLKGRENYWSKGKPNIKNSRPCSEETKQKMRKPRPGSGEKISKAKKGFKYSEESKKKISKTLRENNHSKYYTEEVKMKIRKSKGSKPVLQFDLNNNFIKEWEYLSEVRKHFRGDIQACCKGKQKTAAGYKWKYKEK